MGDYLKVRDDIQLFEVDIRRLHSFTVANLILASAGVELEVAEPIHTFGKGGKFRVQHYHGRLNGTNITLTKDWLTL